MSLTQGSGMSRSFQASPLHSWVSLILYLLVYTTKRINTCLGPLAVGGPPIQRQSKYGVTHPVSLGCSALNGCASNHISLYRMEVESTRYRTRAIGPRNGRERS